MRLKQSSKRRWKARLKQGRWIPRMVIEAHSLTAPEGDKLVWHPEEDFIKSPIPFQLHTAPTIQTTQKEHGMGNRRCGGRAEVKNPRNPGKIDRPPHVLRKTSANK